ncbi:MAG: hypothetical protein HY016_02440 [Nitrosomonadales bacterium]|nr:hypothetical protein [Nitrosomonadales bacterium]
MRSPGLPTFIAMKPSDFCTLSALDVLKLQTTVACDNFGRKVKETDPLNRLSQASLGGQTQSYVYDDQGRRIGKTIGASTT